jgi:trans-2,3-dihydro-3-hydroxyanthranilate isomerase
MPTYPYVLADAFTDRPLGGNPCAVIFDADPLDAPTMQAIAREMNLSETAFVALRARGDFFSPHLFCLGGATAAGRTFARHFGLPPDTPEDPFTGSATGGMAAYLWHYGLIDAPTWVAEQGHWMGRPGQATVAVVGPPAAIRTVQVGGSAVVLIRGQLQL